MKPKYLLIIIVVAITLVAFFQLLNADSDLPNSSPTPIPTSDPLPSQNDNVEVPVESRITPRATQTQLTTPVVHTEDGPTLLKNQCAKCHTVHLIQLTKKNRAEWEKTLSLMERMGAKLSEAEKSVLIDYLAEPSD